MKYAIYHQKIVRAVLRFCEKDTDFRVRQMEYYVCYLVQIVLSLLILRFLIHKRSIKPLPPSQSVSFHYIRKVYLMQTLLCNKSLISITSQSCYFRQQLLNECWGIRNTHSMDLKLCMLHVSKNNPWSLNLHGKIWLRIHKYAFN